MAVFASAMCSVPDFVDNGIKSVVFVGLVIHYPGRPIRFLQTVRSLHGVPIALLKLLLFVASMRIMNGVIEIVLWVRLRGKKSNVKNQQNLFDVPKHSRNNRVLRRGRLRHDLRNRRPSAPLSRKRPNQESRKSPGKIRVSVTNRRTALLTYLQESVHFIYFCIVHSRGCRKLFVVREGVCSTYIVCSTQRNACPLIIK